MAINQWKDDDRTQVSVLTSLLDAELHKSHLLVKQSAMFFAVMAASYLREQAQFDPSEITQLGDHVVDHLKPQSSLRVFFRRSERTFYIIDLVRLQNLFSVLHFAHANSLASAL
jgi:hypothetical protein